jgi:glycosyltransferase involved in cell wall biosynthesis
LKAYINRKVVQGPWGGGNLWLKAAYEFLPIEGIQIVNLNEIPDVIFLAGIGPDDGCISALQAIQYKSWCKNSHGKDVKLILRVNENDARKNTNNVDNLIADIAKHVDHVVFVSKWLKDYFHAEDWKKSSSVIYNGVDESIYKTSTKLNNGKINIVTHHWSDNYLKGFDVYQGIDDWLTNNLDFTFTYIGRHKSSFKNTRHIQPLFGHELGHELAKYDVYVSASRFDPGPNHIIESLSCNIPTYVHKDGGGCVEFAGADHVYNDINELFNVLGGKSYKQNIQWRPNSWNNCIKSFAEIAKDLLNEKCT